ncbi:MAG: hypothetical protein J7L08_04445, partial [Candidatus Aenigmarchaeota archaeon]|nr:hypothetical protein [Candidatus Aenigmarchaeota archaeon]
MTKNLKILKDNKESLLKVELAGWLHDMYKCSDEFIDKESFSPMLSIKNVDKTFYFDSIKDFDIYFQGAFKERASLTELIQKGKPGKTTMENKNLSLLVKYLGRAHGAAHIEKEESNSEPNELKKLKEERKLKKKKLDSIQNSLTIKQENAEKALREKGSIPLKLNLLINQDKESIRKISKELSDIENQINRLIQEQKKYAVKQNPDSTFISSVFGYEYNKISDLTSQLKSFLKKKQILGYKDINAIRGLFSEALGDTRRPANEITLEDWSFLVATLFKSSVAGAILRAGNGQQPLEADELKWRFLSIRINSEQTFGNSVSISDLLARKKWVTEGLDNVKRLIEEEYPMGNEVYRDEEGSIFVVPDIKDILKYEMSDAKSTFGPDSELTFENIIRKNLGFEGEITPEISLSKSWLGQNPSLKPDPERDELPPIGEIISKMPVSPADPTKIAYYWSKNQNKQICRVSWLRPEDDSIRHVSKFWADKAKSRAETWLKEKNTTIWIDEIADNTSKVALISAKLDISNWVSESKGKLSFIRTLNYETPPTSKCYEKCAKTPSFVRVRRVWETTSKFWNEALAKIKEIVGTKDVRLIIKVKSDNLGRLNNNNAYEVETNGARFTVFLYKNYFENGVETAECIVIENPYLLAQKMGLDEKQNDLINNVINEIKKKIYGKTIRFYDPNSPSRVLVDSEVYDFEIDTCSYSPVIEITKDPERFMVLVPANKALEIAKTIKEKYEKEMGKVRNRLPLNLGIVYAKYHTALPAIMDAGRRLMRINNKEEKWTLTKQPEEYSDHFELSFENGQIWKIPSKM